MSKNTIVDDTTMDVGSVYINHNRQFSRQMAVVSGTISDFTIKYTINLTGLHFENEAVVKDSEVLRPNTNVISTELGSVNCNDFINEVIKESEDFEIISAHITNDHVWLTKYPLEGYTDVFPEGYSKFRWNVNSCTAVPAKDSVMMVIKNNPLGRSELNELVKKILIQITGGEFADGFTIKKDGKVIAEFQRDREYDRFWIHICCAEIDYDDFNEDEILSTIGSTGLTPNEAISEFLNIFNTAVNKDEIVLNGTYIEPDAHGRFTILNSVNEFKFYINKPKLLDSNFNIVSSNTLHTLKQISEGVYEYVKYPDLDCFINSSETAYIDVETCYSTVADGFVSCPLLQSTWAGARNAAVGDLPLTTQTQTRALSGYSYQDKIGATYLVYRDFYYFNTSSIAVDDVILSAAFKVYQAPFDITSWTTSYSSGCVQKGTQAATLVSADYSHFSGSAYGTVAGSAGWKTINFNSTGISDIVKAGTTKICGRELAHDYNNVAPTASFVSYQFCVRSVNYTGTTYDPYLEITLEESTGIMPVMTIF